MGFSPWSDRPRIIISEYSRFRAIRFFTYIPLPDICLTLCFHVLDYYRLGTRRYWDLRRRAGRDGTVHPAKKGKYINTVQSASQRNVMSTAPCWIQLRCRRNFFWRVSLSISIPPGLASGADLFQGSRADGAKDQDRSRREENSEPRTPYSLVFSLIPFCLTSSALCSPLIK